MLWKAVRARLGRKINAAVVSNAGIVMATAPPLLPHKPEYVWELATLYPPQGEWSEEEYLGLTDSERRRIEFTDGRLEFLPMPTESHEAMMLFLLLALREFVDNRQIGKVYSSGIRLRIRPRKIRLPDIIFLHKDHFHARHNRVWDGADLVMEIVSDDPKDRQRDYETKLADYAEAKIAEYWIVDFDRRLVIVHRLDGDRYAVHGKFSPTQHATSALLNGFSVDVAALFAAAEDVPE
jgi:Uma2 family endonuclease